jgi:osmotically inducible protein OsmC
MAVRNAHAVWQGDLRSGNGSIKTESGALDGSYSFGSRFVEDKEPGTNPDELLGAALASCYSMALANMLAQEGHTPDRVATEARVHVVKGDEGFGVPKIELICEATVPGIARDAFLKHAKAAKEGCPISKALKVQVTLDATLTS